MNDKVVATADQWFGGLSEKDLDVLSGIASEVKDTVESAVKSMVRSKMKIGELLNEAREIFPGDNEFGKWRRETFAEISPTECSYCQKIAKTFSSDDKMIETVGWSALRELSYAPPVLLNRLKAGEEKMPENKAEAREMVKEAKGGGKKQDIEDADYTEITGKEGLPADATAPPAEVKDELPVKIGIYKYPYLTPEQKMAYFTNLPMEERVNRADEYDRDPYVMLGLPGDTETMIVSDDVLVLILESWKHQYPDQFDLLKEAVDDISSLIAPKRKALKTAMVAERIKAQDTM